MLPGIGFVFDELVHIGVNGETISATPTHPFYVDKLGWTLARSLRAGDILVLSNGELVTVEWVQHEILVRNSVSGWDDKKYQKIT